MNRSVVRSQTGTPVVHSSSSAPEMSMEPTRPRPATKLLFVEDPSPTSNNLVQSNAAQQTVSDTVALTGQPTKTLQFVHPSRFICEKCGCTEYHTGEIRSSSGFLTKIFNVDSNRYYTLTCSGCGFTQMFRTQQSMLANLIDIVIR